MNIYSTRAREIKIFFHKKMKNFFKYFFNYLGINWLQLKKNFIQRTPAHRIGHSPA